MKRKSDETHKKNTGAQDNINQLVRTEEALRESEIKYQILFESASDAILLMDQDIYIDCNKKTLEMFGCTRKQIIGQSPYRFSPEVQPDGRNSIEKGMEKINAAIKGQPQYFEWRHCRYDGTLFDAEISLNAFNDKGKYYIQAIVRDINERKRAEEALRNSEDQLRAILDKTPFPIALIDNSQDNNIDFWSHSALTLFGHTASTAGEWYKIAYPDPDYRRDVIDRWKTILDIAHQSRQTMNGGEYRVTCNDGSVRTCELYATFLAERLIVTFNDITERKRAEEDLYLSEERYRLIAENTADTINIFDLNFNKTYVSPSILKLRGYTVQEAMTQSLDQMLTPDSLEQARKVFAEQIALESSETADPARTALMELEEYCKDGSTIWVELAVSFLRDNNLKPTGILTLTRNITDRKKSEEALKKSEAKYRNIFENAVEGIYQSTIEGRLITANAAFARMAGYDSPEELIESIKNMETQLYVHPEDRKRFMEIREAKGFIDGFEVEFYKKDGSKFWVVINARTVKDEQGNILYIEGLIENITIRKHAEEQLQQTLESLRKAVGTTIQVLVSAVESRDPYTAGHQKRVADLARAIATKMGFPPDTIDGIRMAGSIHDIGKLSIPAEILSKPTKLTDIEYSLIKEHAKSGYEMLKDVESPWPLAQIVYQHHERMNGTGYPRNLKGDEILIEARIMAVADVVEAMASHRPYRPTLGIEAALEEIEKNKGILYDDAVADACLKLFRENGYQLK
jgi:PAS domain S-box-containing protein/putative nucleotidyltransferase with HDIG domain